MAKCDYYCELTFRLQYFIQHCWRWNVSRTG